jgi:hypothetical protein
MALLCRAWSGERTRPRGWATLTLGQAESATEAVAVAPRRPAHELRLADAAAELAAFLGKQLELRLG